MIRCPDCNADTVVSETRDTATGVRRRRHCPQCKRKVTTYEFIVLGTDKRPVFDTVMVRRADLAAMHKKLGTMIATEPTEIDATHSPTQQTGE